MADPTPPVPGPLRYRLTFERPIDGDHTREFATLAACQDFVGAIRNMSPCRIDDRRSGRYGTLYPSGAQRWRR